MDDIDGFVQRILRLTRDSLLRTSGAASFGAPDLESPVEPDELEIVEAALGFRLPELLLQLYLSGLCLPELYPLYRESSEEIDLPPWQPKVLPLVATGCSLVDSVDCSTAGCFVVEGTDDGPRPTGIRFYDWMEKWASEMEFRRNAA